MSTRWVLIATLLPCSAFACNEPVCLVRPDTLDLAQIITFEDIQSSAGPGHYVDNILPLPGATFGERFAGQIIEMLGNHDHISGSALSPLTVVPGARGQNLSVVRFYGNTVLNGYGKAGFPRREAQGEGSIAVLFDDDQNALSFDLRGGEAGAAHVSFFRRDGSFISTVKVEPTGEFAVGFRRTALQPDIAGFVLSNTDPEGLAIDTLRFGNRPGIG